jgi:cardiolipin synthase
MADWRDTNVEVSGDVVVELQHAFNNMWWIVSNERFLRLKEPRQTEDGFSVLTNAPHFRQRHIDRAVIEAIRTAEKSIYITTPYFVPDRRFFRVIRLAARRGVDVRIIVPYQSDHPYVDFASQFYFQKALKAGVKLFWYMPTMMHAKTVVIDGEWASVGSANVDNLSSFFNYELNLVSVARGFAEDVETHFFTDLGRSIEVKTTEWQARPLLRKILEMISAPFGRFF